MYNVLVIGILFFVTDAVLSETRGQGQATHSQEKMGHEPKYEPREVAMGSGSKLDTPQAKFLIDTIRKNGPIEFKDLRDKFVEQFGGSEENFGLLLWITNIDGNNTNSPLIWRRTTKADAPTFCPRLIDLRSNGGKSVTLGEAAISAAVAVSDATKRSEAARKRLHDSAEELAARLDGTAVLLRSRAAID